MGKPAPAVQKTPAKSALPVKGQAAAAPAAPERLPLERTCACGNHTPLGGECAACREARLEGRGEFGKVSILDSDPTRAEATRVLLAELLDQLGLQIDTFTIQVDGGARSRLAARRTGGYEASGLVQDRQVFLHPERYHPEQPGGAGLAGRALLGHELAHLAQEQRASQADGLSPLFAEQEARQVGEAFAAGRLLPTLREALPVNQPAADVGDPVQVSVETVRQSRRHELRRIDELLSYGIFDWAITDGDVTAALNILAGMPFATAQAVVAALGPEKRTRLVDNINPVHFRAYRPQVLAAYAALTAQELARFNENLLREMNFSNLSPEEHEAVLYTFRSLPRPKQLALLDPSAPSREPLAAIVTGPGLTEEQRLEMAVRTARAGAEEVQAAEAARERSGRYDRDPHAQEQLRYLREHAGDPNPAWNRLAAIVDDDPLFRYLVEKLEEEGFLDRLIEGLPENERAQPPDRAQAFLKAISYRPIFKNVEMAERLLSTGWFNGVSREEARFAYLLIRRLPLDAQERFRRYDNGRLLRNLEEGFGAEGIQSGEYGGLELTRREGRLVDVSAEYRRRVAEDPEHNITFLEDLLRQGLNEERALQMFQRLSAIYQNHPERQPGGLAAGGAPTLLEAIVHRIDSQGGIDSMFDELRREITFAEENRPATLRIMLARDPIHIQIHARQLLEQGIFNAVTAREAYLAYQLIRALPDDERQRFIENEPELWSRITGEMTEEMLRSSDLNAHVERTSGGPRARVVAQLLNEETWTAHNAARLRSLASMAIAAGERRLVFEQSQRFRAYSIPELQAMVRDFGLYDPADPSRTTYQPRDLHPAGAEGIFQTIAESAGFVVSLVGSLGSLLFSGNVNLEQARRAAGYLSDHARSVRLEERPEGQQEGARTDTRTAEDGTTHEVVSNQIHLVADLNHGIITAELPILEIASMNLHLANRNIQTGAVRASNIRLVYRYSTPEMRQPTHMELNTTTVNLQDLLFAERESLVAASAVNVQTLHLAGSSEDVTRPEGVHDAPSWFAFIPLIGPLLRVIASIAGTRREPLMDFEVSFTSLNVEGLNINGAQQVGGIEVRDFHLRAGLTRPAYLRALIPSLTNRREAEMTRAQQAGEEPDTVELDRRLREARTELLSLADAERDFLRLNARAQSDPASLSPDETNQLARLREQLRGGVVADVGSLRLTGVEGQVTTDEISLSALHGEGENVDMALLAGPGMLSNPELLQRLSRDPDPRALNEAALGEGTFRLELGRLHTQRLEVRQSIPTAAQLEDQLRELEPARSLPERAFEIRQLEQRLALVREFERLSARDTRSLNDDQRRRLVDLERTLSQDVVLRTGELELQGARLDANLRRGEQTLFARRLSAHNIEMPQRGIRVASIEGRDVSAGRFGGTGLSGLTNLLSGTDSVTVRASELTVSGARMSFNEDALRAELEVLRGLPEESLNDSQRLRRDNLVRLEDELNDIHRRIADSDRAVQAAVMPEERARAEAELAENNRLLEGWLTRYSVESISAQGLNASGGLDFFFAAGQLQQGVRVTGEGEGGRLFDRLTVRGFTKNDPLNPGRVTTMRELGLGPTSGSVSLSWNGFRFQNVHIDSAQVNELFFNSPTMQIGGQNSLTLTGIDLTGSIRFAPPEPGARSGTPQSQERTILEIEHMLIQRIEARDLDYYDGVSRVDVTIRSGALRLITLDNFLMEMPETGASRYRGGRATVQAAEDIDFQAAWVDGVRRAHGRISAQTLTAGIAEDGAVTVDLAALQLMGGRLTDEDLDLGINLNARGIHAELREGRRAVSVREASGRVRGRAYGAEFDAEFERLAGSVVMTPGRWEVPALSLPLLTLNAFNYSSDTQSVRIPEGGSAVAENLTAALAIEWNEPPEPAVRPGERPPPGPRPSATIRRIIITHFEMPTLRVRGLEYTKNLAGGNFTLSLPASETGLVEGLTLTPLEEGGEGFIIQPATGGGWQFLGTAGARSLDFRRLRAGIAGTFNLLTDVRASNLSIRLMSDGHIPIHVDTLDLTNIEAEAGRSRFRFLRSAAPRGEEARISLQGGNLLLDTTRSGAAMVESASAEGVEITGLDVDYPDKGITARIRRARLPGGFNYQRSGRVQVPNLRINDAHFRINDVLALASSSSSGPSASLANYNFLNNLGGTLALNLYLPIEINLSGGGFGATVEVHRIQNVFPVQLLIINGRISFVHLEHTALGNTLDEVIDFTVRNNQIVLEFDPQRLANAVSLLPFVGPIPGGLGALARTDIMTWTPGTPSEISDANRGMVSLQRLLNPDPSGAPSTHVRPVMRYEQMELRDVNAALNLFGENTIDLGPMGRIHMGAPGGRESVSSLTLSGSTSTGITLEMQEMIARLENLTLMGATVNTGFIVVQNVRNVNFTFGNTYNGTYYRAMPRSVEGDIEAAVAQNIVVTFAGPGSTP